MPGELGIVCGVQSTGAPALPVCIIIIDNTAIHPPQTTSDTDKVLVQVQVDI